MEAFFDGRVALHHGDCLEVLAGLPENSVDSVVTDPPYHLTSIVRRFGGEGAAHATDGATGAYKRASAGFMGKQWDGGDIAFRPDVWLECLRVLKPGGYLLAFASTRGIWRMGVAIEDAGFIPHPMIAWVFGRGFPKATRIKAEGYDGWRYGGQSLKPAIEPIFMGQKPFSEANGTANIRRWGTGAVNIDGCRVDAGGARRSTTGGLRGKTIPVYGSFARDTVEEIITTEGRWPANLIHDGSEEVLAAFPETGVARSGGRSTGRNFGQHADDSHSKDRERTGHDDNGGSAARFFYSAKAGAEDRIGSKHPTIKPVDLMRYLVRLVTPPGGVVLDPFAGTGTTGQAAYCEGCSAVLIEREAGYLDDIRRRMALVLAGPDERRREAAKAAGRVQPDAGPLFVGGGG